MNIKRISLYLVLMFTLIISNIKIVGAMTPSTSSTYIDNGYSSYTINLVGGGTASSHRTSNAGVYRLVSTAGSTIYCAELGKDYPGGQNLSKSNTSEIASSGQICGIINSFNSADGEDYTLNGSTTKVKITYSDIANQATNNTSYKKIQQMLWKYQAYTGTCSKTYVNEYNSDTKTAPAAVLTTSDVSESGTNYIMVITLEINNSNSSLVGDPTIKIDGTATTFAKTVNGTTYKYQYTYSVPKSSYASKTMTVSYSYQYNSHKLNKEYPYLDKYNASSGYQDIVILKLGTETTQEKDTVNSQKQVSFSVNEGKILVEKYQKGTDNKIDTATFGLFSDNACTTTAKNIYNTNVSNANTTEGVATFNHLLYGTYYVKEITAPDGYFKNDDCIKVEVNAATVTKRVDNEKKIIISKQGITGSGEIEGAHIQLYVYNTTKLYYEKPASNSKYSWVSGTTPHEIYLEEGYYIFEETVAPTGYKKLKNAFTIHVSSDGKVTVSKRSDDPTKDSIGTVKQSGTGYILEYSDSPQTCIEVSETQCINIINVNSDKDTLTIKNEPMKLKISKKDITGSKEIDGSTLVITNDKDSKYKKTIKPKAGEDNSFELEYLEPSGTTKYYYYLEETVAPKGYKQITTVFKFSVDEYGVPTLVAIGNWKNGKFNQTKKVSTHDNIILSSDEITVLNEPIKIVFSKKDSSTSKYLEGAHIVITPADNNKKAIEFDTKNKDIELDLEPGVYYIKETVAPEGYEELKLEYKIEITEEKTVKLLSESSDNISI